ncbi:MAG: c-type cytochrome [Gemmatimonadaceae bacterium]
MRTPFVVLSFLCATANIAHAILQQSAPPPWAFGFTAPPPPGAAAPSPAPVQRAVTPPRARVDTVKRTLAGSALSFTAAEIRDANAPADWFPGDHPPMPPIVARGRVEANVSACGLCHYPNGKGRPENSGVAGLPESYVLQTFNDFRSGARHSSDPRKANTNNMIGFAKAMTDDEMKAVAEYFSSMKWTPWIRVVETDSVPKTRIATGMFIPLDGAPAGKEAIGSRIIEVPENVEETETLRNPRSGFIAYVPKGAVKKGAELAARAQCVLCHGAALTGLGPVPGIAGRSPSYMARQLYDIQHGARKGLWSELMKGVVGPLSNEDMLNLAAYVASRTP